MTKRQVEELAKIFMDIGKLTFASLVLGFFQTRLDPTLTLIYESIGLIFTASFFYFGLKLFKEVT